MGDTKFHRRSSYEVIEHSSVSFEWKIEGYNSLFTACSTERKRGRIQSELFASKTDEKRKWYIEFVPKKLERDSRKELRIELHKTDIEEIYVQAFIYLSAEANWVKMGEGYNGILGGRSFIALQDTIGKLAEKISLNKCIPDTLKIVVDIRTYFKNDFKPPINLVSRDLSEDISTFFEDQILKDFSFFIQGKEFTAHKIILAARSEVFAAMLKNEMSEGLTSKVIIDDIEPEIFEKMLRFIYSDKINDLNAREAFLLFVAAHRYDLHKLKNICILSLYENLSIDTVIKTLQLADLYSLEKLRQHAMEFLSLHHNELKNTSEFLSMVRSHPHFALELLNLQADIYKKK